SMRDPPSFPTRRSSDLFGLPRIAPKSICTTGIDLGTKRISAISGPASSMWDESPRVHLVQPLFAFQICMFRHIAVQTLLQCMFLLLASRCLRHVWNLCAYT